MHGPANVKFTVGMRVRFWRSEGTYYHHLQGRKSVRWQCSPVIQVGVNQEREGTHGLRLSPLLLVWGEHYCIRSFVIMIIKTEMPHSQKTVTVMFNDCNLKVIYIVFTQCKHTSNAYIPHRQYQSTLCLRPRLKNFSCNADSICLLFHTELFF